MTGSAEELRLVLGLKVRAWRQARELSLKQLAAASGLSISYLSEIEKGRKYPKPEKLMDLARGLEVEYDDLVSLKVGEDLAGLTDVFDSIYLRQFPFHLFGVEASDVLGLGEPDHAAALLRTFADIGRMYGVEVDHFLLAALRSYQQLQRNSFPDLEEAATEFRASLPGRQRVPSTAALREVLEQEYGYRIDDDTLAGHPELGSFRSVFAAGETPVLYLNSRLLPEQQAFLLAREIGHRVLGLEERAITSTWIDVESFEQILNNFRASYFAGALLIDREWLIKELRKLFGRKRWEPDRFLDILHRSRSTPEMFFHRLTEVVPTEMGFSETYFLRFSRAADSAVPRLTKLLDMSKVPLITGVGHDEHFCRRWSAIRILERLAREPHRADAPIVSARRSHFFEFGQEFFVLSMARPLALDESSYSSVTLGFRLDAAFRKQVAFADDPALLREDIHTTCERCPLSAAECTDRVAPPVQVERAVRQRERAAAVERFLSESSMD